MWCPPVHVFTPTCPWYPLCVNTLSVGSFWQNKALPYLCLVYTHVTVIENITKFTKDNVTLWPLPGCLTNFLPPTFPLMQNYFPAAFKVTKICYFLGHHKWPGQFPAGLSMSCPLLCGFLISWPIFSVLLNRIKPTCCALENQQTYINIAI